MLVFFAFIVFVAMAFAGLVVDLGMARLTQMQMQTAADGAALEGLRFRDDLPAVWRPEGTTPPHLPQALFQSVGPQPNSRYDPTNPAWQKWIDGARRFAAIEIVAVTFDDDLNPANGDKQQFGAGPIASVTDTVGDPSLQAGGMITLPQTGPPVYKPTLEANATNAANGDLVAGAYGWNQSYDPSATADESVDYMRRDFTPNSPAGSVSQTGFLARLRRSHENFSGATGTASNAPTLPFLFGRGSMLARSSDSGGLTIESGITVRATAIAAAGTVSLRPQAGTTPTTSIGHVLSAGAVDPTTGIRGAAPFGLTATYWASLNNAASGTKGTDLATVNPATGVITSNLVPPTGGNTNPNASEAGIVGANVTQLKTIGQIYAAVGSDASLSVSPTLYLYVPIYSTIGTTARTIVGFGFVQWTYTTGQLSLTAPWNAAQNAPADRIAAENASASLVTSLPPLMIQSGPANVQQLFAANVALPASLLSPALANHYFGPNFEP
ncbi:MAG TPA: Tad domain-containing protein [Planctomycetaceae bacterium]|nr:Tad domain-containing protein [Planctomycetaceae bacterium]